MMTKGMMVVIATLALGVGFAGGIWFIHSGTGFQLIGGSAASAVGPGSPGQPGATKGSSRSLGFGGGGSFPLHRAARNDLSPSAGCEWVIEPTPLHRLLESLRDYKVHDVLRGSVGNWLGAFPKRGLYSDFGFDQATGGFRYTLVEFTTGGRKALDLRPVYFDRTGNRYLPTTTGQSRTPNASDEVQVTEFYLDPAKSVPPEQVVYYGIERVVPAAEHEVAATAQSTAKEKGIKILPIPRIGEPYPFDLTTVDGKRLRTEDFHGKVVLIGLWNSEPGSPFLLMNLASIRQTVKEDEVVIIGISFEDSIAKARATLSQSKAKTTLSQSKTKETLGSPTKESLLVVIPNDPKVRDLWLKGGQINRFPYYFLIDHDGILRYTSPFSQLFESIHLRDRVDILLGRFKRFGIFRAMAGPPRPQPREKTAVQPGRTDGSAQ